MKAFFKVILVLYFVLMMLTFIAMNIFKGTVFMLLASSVWLILAMTWTFIVFSHPTRSLFSGVGASLALFIGIFISRRAVPEENPQTTLDDAWQQAYQRIERFDARLLLEHVCGCKLIAHPERAMSEEEVRRFEELVSRRAAGEPLKNLLGPMKEAQGEND